MQGRLRSERLSATLETSCAHCAEPIVMEVDSEMGLRRITPGAQPVISLPLIDIPTIKAPSITDDF